MSSLREPIRLGMQRSSSAGMVGKIDSRDTDREVDLSNHLRKREKEKEQEAEQKREWERQQQLRNKEQEDRLREKEREEERLRRRRSDDHRGKDEYQDPYRVEKESGLTLHLC